MASRIEMLRKQHELNETSKQAHEENYNEVLDTIMNRSGESSMSSTSKEIADIDINLIDTDDLNEKLFGYEDLYKIEESFDEIGNNSIIYVYRKPNGRYLCFAGNQRLLVSKKKGEKTITCMIAGDEPGEEKRMENLIFMNSQRSVRPYYIAMQLKTYERIVKHKGNGNTVKLIEQKFGIKKTQQSYYKQILSLPETLQELFKRDDIPFKKLLDTCRKVPFGKEQEYVDTFNFLTETEEVEAGLISKALRIVNNEEADDEEPKPKKPIKTSQAFKEISSLPYFEDEVVIPEDKKEAILAEAQKLQEYSTKLIRACSSTTADWSF